MYPLEYTCNPYWPPSASSSRKRPRASTSVPRCQWLLWISPFSSNARPGSGRPLSVRTVPVITVAAAAPDGSARTMSQSARETDRMSVPPSLWRAADRPAGEPRHQKGDDVSGGLPVPPERRQIPLGVSEGALERLTLPARGAREVEHRGSKGVEIVAGAAPARVEPFTARDALGERAEPALEDRLAG